MSEVMFEEDERFFQNIFSEYIVKWVLEKDEMHTNWETALNPY